jgi:glycosyltransferase involved in cell wall biosynthesis
MTDFVNKLTQSIFSLLGLCLHVIKVSFAKKDCPKSLACHILFLMSFSMPPSKNLMIGVVIPTFNRPDLLDIALKSLQAQSYQNWKAVVINDLSSVDYQSVELVFSEDSRIRFFTRASNGGVNQACNTGLDQLAADGDVDFIAIMDDDDTYALDFFEAAVVQIHAHPEYSWFMSNNYGEQKKSSRRIMKEGELDYVDDYIYGKFRGDKGRLIAAWILKELRFDPRFRSSHRWPFFTDVAQHTKIWAFPHDSVYKRYLDQGITKSVGASMSLKDILHSVYKHWHVIRLRPTKLAAYKYLILESLKAIPRALRRCIYYLTSK